jgi:hypothetical protein
MAPISQRAARHGAGIEGSYFQTLNGTIAVLGRLISSSASKPDANNFRS